jgi:hypothetical protein
MFLAKYDPTKTPPNVWAQGFSALSGAGSSGYASGQGVVVDSTGQIVVTGKAYGAVYVGDKLVAPGSEDILLAKFRTDGYCIWAKSYGGLTQDTGSGITVGAGNNILATGTFNNSVDFDDTDSIPPMQSPGGIDGFVVKLTP